MIVTYADYEARMLEIRATRDRKLEEAERDFSHGEKIPKDPRYWNAINRASDESCRDEAAAYKAWVAAGSPPNPKAPTPEPANRGSVGGAAVGRLLSRDEDRDE